MRAVKARRIRGRNDVRIFDIGERDIAEHADRQIAITGVFAHRDQERFDIARTEAVAEHQTVGVAGFEIARGGFDAERADGAGAFADRDRERRVSAAAAGDDHGGIVERIVARHIGKRMTVGLRHRGAAYHRAVQAARAQGGGQARGNELRCRVGSDRQRFAIGDVFVVRYAGDHGNDRRERGDLLRQPGGELFIAGRHGIGQQDRAGLGRGDRVRGFVGCRLDERECAGRSECAKKLTGRIFGDDDEGTL